MTDNQVSGPSQEETVAESRSLGGQEAPQQVQPGKYTMSMDRQLVLSEAGEVYQRKRPLSQQALFWTSLVLGGFALILFGLMTTYWNQKQAMESALRRQGLYYDSFTQDIYQDEVQEESGVSGDEEIPYIRDRLKKENLIVLEEMETTPESVTFSESTEALDALELALEGYLGDLSVLVDNLYDWGELTNEDYNYYQKQMAAYRNQMVDDSQAIRLLYGNKENRAWLEQERSDLLDHLANLLDPDHVMFPEVSIRDGISA